MAVMMHKLLHAWRARSALHAVQAFAARGHMARPYGGTFGISALVMGGRITVRSWRCAAATQGVLFAHKR